MKVRSAWIIVDLVNDFVEGVFGSSRAMGVVQETSRVLSTLKDRLLIVFTQDSHIHNDPEFRIWGEHCLMDGEGSKLHRMLNGFQGYRIRKRHYDAFYDTDLQGFLLANDIRKLYISGISTDICVQHTVCGAFMRYYDISVISDLCTSIDGRRHDESLNYMSRNYGITIMNSSDFVSEVMN